MGFNYLELTYPLFLIQFILLAFGILVLMIISEKFKPFITSFCVISIGIISSTLAIIGIIENGFEILINGGSFIGTIPIRIDSLSAWFILIINIVTATGVIYGIGYIKAYKPNRFISTLHWSLFLLFQSSMLLVCMVQNSIAFIVSWEIMSLSSLFLVLFDYENPKVLKAGINYLVQMHLSVAFLTIAFIWVYFKTGTFDFIGISTYFGANNNIWLFVVFFVGFGFKAGFIGLHTWLPHAHPAAPSHISGVMSGVIVKMGIYGIFRVITCLRADYLLLGEIVLGISLISGMFGITNAAMQRDFKKMLAYCTIENIGIIGIGIGIGLIGLGKNQNLLCFFGFGGALLHVLNHSLFKSLLFYSAGSIYQQTHTRNMDFLGGLIKKMPKTAIIFLVGAIAIAGIPPFNGFISEFLIYCGLLSGFTSAGITQTVLMVLSFAGLSIIGGVSILTFSKTFGTIFLGSPRKELAHEPKEVSFLMLLPQYVTIILMITIAFVPSIFIKLTGNIVNGSFGINMNMSDPNLKSYFEVLSNISLISLSFILIIVVIYLLRFFLTRKSEKTYSSTWGCAYVAPNTKMQYTGKSFSKTLGKLTSFMVVEEKTYDEIATPEIFPNNRSYKSFYSDLFELKIINPAIKQLKNFINLFQFVQNGKIQAYVIYGIVFILAIFLGTILNVLK
jgi:formate hydrogenlyase subunit 3/multisubunit Na+/H+ antiporter MnhD subunit